MIKLYFNSTAFATKILFTRKSVLIVVWCFWHSKVNLRREKERSKKCVCINMRMNEKRSERVCWKTPQTQWFLFCVFVIFFCFLCFYSLRCIYTWDLENKTAHHKNNTRRRSNQIRWNLSNCAIENERKSEDVCWRW